MGKMIMRVEGLDGSVELLPDRVIIRHDGIWNAFKFGFNSAREIPLAAISEIGFKNSNLIMMGEIDFIVSGGGSRQMQIGKKKAANPNAVRFRKNKQQEFAVLKEKVFELMAQTSAQRKV